jgi:hypothetical protein
MTTGRTPSAPLSGAEVEFFNVIQSAVLFDKEDKQAEYQTICRQSPDFGSYLSVTPNF